MTAGQRLIEPGEILSAMEKRVRQYGDGCEGEELQTVVNKEFANDEFPRMGRRRWMAKVETVAGNSQLEIELAEHA